MNSNFLCNIEPEYPEKTIDMPEVTDKTLSHNVLSNTPRSLSGFELTALVAIGDCISNYYAMTTTTSPRFIVLLTSSYPIIKPYCIKKEKILKD
jgi:hypothetical protein